MEDIDILKQLMHGNHLEDKDLDRAKKLLKLLTVQLKSRVRSG
jgi:hypothetical protein